MFLFRVVNINDRQRYQLQLCAWRWIKSKTLSAAYLPRDFLRSSLCKTSATEPVSEEVTMPCSRALLTNGALAAQSSHLALYLSLRSIIAARQSWPMPVNICQIGRSHHALQPRIADKRRVSCAKQPFGFVP